MSKTRFVPQDAAAPLTGRVKEATGPALIRWTIVVAWTATALGHVSGWERLFGHDELLVGGFPPWLSLVLFLLGWQVMVAAMMLPSSLAGFQRFAGLVPVGEGGSQLLASFLGGYVLVWTAFGTAALVGDGLVHGIVDTWPWLAARPWLIGGAALVLAGGFELVKPARPCRPVAFPGRKPGDEHLGPAMATRLGADHGLRRLRRCWGLMLLSFAAGMTSLAWMVVLTVVMMLEGGERPWRVTGGQVGATLLTLGCLVLLDPAWLPALFPGAW